MRNCWKTLLRRQAKRLIIHRRPFGWETLEPRLVLDVGIVGGARYASIQDAVDHALPGAVIEISAGEYSESISLNRRGKFVGGPFTDPADLTLRGIGDVVIKPSSGQALHNKVNVPFHGNLTIDNLGFTTIKSTGVFLENYHGDLQILNSDYSRTIGSSDTDYPKRGIEVSDSTGSVTITNTDIFDMGTKGIYLNNVENVRIDRVTIDARGSLSTTEDQDGIFGSNVRGIQILNSEIRLVGVEEAEDGIDLNSASGNVRITGNSIHHIGDDGVQITSEGNTVANIVVSRNRIFENGGGGIEVRTSGASTAQSQLEISDNVLYGLGDHAIELYYKSDAQLQAVVQRNDIGAIAIESAIVVDARENAQVSADIVDNNIHGTTGHGLRVVAEEQADISATVRGNTLQSIGNDATDDAILIETLPGSAATVNVILDCNVIRSAGGMGISVRGRGQSNLVVEATHNVIDDTNILSQAAGIFAETSELGVATSIQVMLQSNIVTNLHGADAYRLSQQGLGVMKIAGSGVTAQEVIANHNLGSPVVVVGMVSVNPLPAMDSLAITATEENIAAVGATVTLTGSFRPSAPPVNLVAVVSWGEDDCGMQTPVTPNGDGSYSITASNRFQTGGVYSVTVTVKDGSKLVAASKTSAWVTGWRVNSVGQLQVVGTNLKDKVEIKPSTTLNSVNVKLELDRRKSSFNAGPIKDILVQLGPGDDEAKVDNKLGFDAEIRGASGNDTLTGGSGNDLLLGGPGDDKLKGESGDDILSGGDGNDSLEAGIGRDVLIGGRGVDKLVGSGLVVGNIFIGGWTKHDADPAALRRILAEWTSGLPSATIVQGLTGVGGSLEVGKQVFDDRAKDVLQGKDHARDLFFADRDGLHGDDDTVGGFKNDTVLELGEIL